MTPDGDKDDVGIVGDLDPSRRMRWEDECNGDPDMGMRCTPPPPPPKKNRIKKEMKMHPFSFHFDIITHLSTYIWLHHYAKQTK